MTAGWPTAARTWSARAGTRLALIQAVIVLLAFALAGYLALAAIERLDHDVVRDHVRGEVASLHDEIAQHGMGHLAFTVAKRTRLWRGFDYRLAGPDGAAQAGRLPTASDLGWSEVSTSFGHAHGRPHRFLVFTETLSNGARLTVGQDLFATDGKQGEIERILLICGGLGVIVCLAASYLLSRSAWRRISEISNAAQQVSAGRLDVRAPVRGSRQQDDIDDLGLTFNAMLERIGALIDQLRQVTTDIAHDLRSPLTRVRHKLERLQAQVSGQPDLARAVAAVDDDVVELLRTFDALLQLAEIESDGQTGRTVDLAEAAIRASEAYRPDIEASGRFLAVDCEPAQVVGNEQLLVQLCANLLENALRHTPNGAHISLQVEQSAVGTRLVVVDDGPGVPEANREDALKPFVRLERSRTTKGSGLGLAIVSAIAGRHGATLKLEDAQPGLRVVVAFDPPRRPPVAGPVGADRRVETV